MKTNLLFCTSLVCGIASNAKAVAMAPPDLTLQTYVTATTAACTDFSGTWKGKCSDGKDKIQVIRQTGCELINVDGHSFAIGGLSSESQTIPAGTTASSKLPMAVSIISSYDWNEDQTALNTAHSLMVRPIGKKTWALPASFRGTYRISGSHLAIDMVTQGGKYSCSLDKQS